MIQIGKKIKILQRIASPASELRRLIFLWYTYYTILARAIMSYDKR